jgi:hypothetical protein
MNDFRFCADCGQQITYDHATGLWVDDFIREPGFGVQFAAACENGGVHRPGKQELPE